MVEEDHLHLEEVEPLTMITDEFAARVRKEVEERDTRLVMIDGTAGYRLALREDQEQVLTRELHALVRYLKNMGVTVILTEETKHVTGDFQPTSANISYLADSILFLRYVELEGEIHKTVGVLKKRLSDFERNLRELCITGDRLQIGEPLTGLRGILTGTPEWGDGSGD